jgi:hypothetical protein
MLPIQISPEKTLNLWKIKSLNTHISNYNVTLYAKKISAQEPSSSYMTHMIYEFLTMDGNIDIVKYSFDALNDKM